MTFTPPAFYQLKNSTFNLDVRLSMSLGQYQIIPDSVFAAPSLKLETLLARTHQVITCDSNRHSVKNVFRQLSNELRKVLQSDSKKADYEAKNKVAYRELLGALLHRYFRLINKYDSYCGSFYRNIKDCKLFKALRKALNLPDEMGENFKIEDLKILDAATVVTCLKAFYDNMIFNDKYKQYPHFLKDPNFKYYLEQIIITHRSRASFILEQLKAIDFLQSLLDRLEEGRAQVGDALVKWCKILAKEQSDFSQLTIEFMNDHLEKDAESPAIKGKISDLLNTEYMQKNLKNMDFSSFLVNMNKCYHNRALHILLGGYIFILDSDKITKELTHHLQTALGIVDNPAKLTIKTKLNNITLLCQFVEDNDDVSLNNEFFAGKTEMLRQLSQFHIKLTQDVQMQILTESKISANIPEQPMILEDINSINSDLDSNLAQFSL